MPRDHRARSVRWRDAALAAAGLLLVTLAGVAGAGRPFGWFAEPVSIAGLALVGACGGGGAGAAAAGIAALFSLADAPPDLPGEAVLGGLLLRWAGYGVVVAVAARCRRAIDEARRRARLDPLTRLPNRDAFLEAVERERSRALRGGKPLTVAWIDCDDFKKVNDRRGHAAGDDVLRTVGKRLVDRTRAYDVAGRMGGDEFALLLPETGGEAARAAVARIHAALRIASPGDDRPITCSIGCATFAKIGPSAAEMLRAADEAMYVAKRAGKDRVEYRIVPDGPP
ncbi:MAG: GGDEF domain-containing protein [Planctomycetales bacterium]